MAVPMQNMARICLRRYFPINCIQYPTPQRVECRPSSSAVVETPEPTRKQKISKAMKAYLERAKAHDEFMEQESHLFNVGRRHLANMMGTNPDDFNQDDIDKSIRYLFPSALYEPKARPIMRPPEQVFPKTKAAEFDASGRPHHYLFYTTRPSYSSLLHECAEKLAELDAFEDRMIREQRKPDSEQALDLMGSMWLSKDGVEKMVLEKLVDVEFNKLTAALERIVSHPYGYKMADFVRQFRIQLMAEKRQTTPAEPQVGEDGRRYVTVVECARKSTRGQVTVTMPGTGKFSINGQGIEYFKSDIARNQVRHPSSP